MDRKITGIIIAAFILTLAVNAAAKDPVFTDNFSKDKLDAKWEWIVPDPGPTYSIDTKRGVLLMAVPTDQAYDHWSGDASAPMLALKPPKGNWTFEARVTICDCEEGQQFHIGMFVQFGDLDCYYWGQYMGTKLRLERSGVQNVLAADYDSDTVWLQIRKDGGDYHMCFKKNEKDPWEEAGIAAEDKDPVKIGFIMKTWNAVSGEAEFSSVKLY